MFTNAGHAWRPQLASSGTSRVVLEATPRVLFVGVAPLEIRQFRLALRVAVAYLQLNESRWCSHPRNSIRRSLHIDAPVNI